MVFSILLSETFVDIIANLSVENGFVHKLPRCKIMAWKEINFYLKWKCGIRSEEPVWGFVPQTTLGTAHHSAILRWSHTLWDSRWQLCLSCFSQQDGRRGEEVWGQGHIIVVFWRRFQKATTRIFCDWPDQSHGHTLLQGKLVNRVIIFIVIVTS